MENAWHYSLTKYLLIRNCEANIQFRKGCFYMKIKSGNQNYVRFRKNGPKKAEYGELQLWFSDNFYKWKAFLSDKIV